jgi:regulator of CtrA degradation
MVTALCVATKRGYRRFNIMAEPADLSPTIIESLYSEALMLADDARATFDMSGRLDVVGEDEDLARVALSCEA